MPSSRAEFSDSLSPTAVHDLLIEAGGVCNRANRESMLAVEGLRLPNVDDDGFEWGSLFEELDGLHKQHAIPWYLGEGCEKFERPIAFINEMLGALRRKGRYSVSELGQLRFDQLGERDRTSLISILRDDIAILQVALDLDAFEVVFRRYPHLVSELSRIDEMERAGVIGHGHADFLNDLSRYLPAFLEGHRLASLAKARVSPGELTTRPRFAPKRLSIIEMRRLLAELADKQKCVMTAIWESGPEGLDLRTLEKNSGYDRPQDGVYHAMKKAPWSEIVLLPGAKGRGPYRLINVEWPEGVA